MALSLVGKASGVKTYTAWNIPLENALAAKRAGRRRPLPAPQPATSTVEAEKSRHCAARVFFLPRRLMRNMARTVPGNSANVVQNTFR